MRAFAIERGSATVAGLEGRIACHDVRDGAGKIAVEKGQTLDAQAAGRLVSLAWDEIHLLELEPGDLHEEPAGARLSAAAAGPGVEVKGYAGGQWTLAATRRGLLSVRHEALAAVNAVEGMSVFTLYDLQPVEPGEAVAKAKITPLAMPEELVKRAEERAWAAGGLLTVKAFAPRVLRNSAANSAHEFDVLISTIRMASMHGRGGSALMRWGVSPDCTQRQNFFSAETRTLR